MDRVGSLSHDVPVVVDWEPQLLTEFAFDSIQDASDRDT
jgi:hypothetical protein